MPETDQVAPETPEVATPVVGEAAGEKQGEFVPKAQWEATEAELAKARKQVNDLRATEIGNLREFERGTTNDDLRDTIEALNASIKEGNLEGFPDRVAALRAKQSEAALTADFTARSTETVNEIVALAQELGVDASVHPSFENARLYYQNAEDESP